ncbi:MAG TPA: VCBS repeat-containing protein, partial [Pirellulaceae bacterium]|nr:VCBS repeat-containing protein [Pirellulaceae bacterium]
AELASFFAYQESFAGGVFVAAGDINGDGRADVITGADADPQATGGHVKVFDGATGAEVRSFFAFPGFSGGVRVAAGDLNGDGLADIITGAGPGAGPHVKVFDGLTHAELRSFFAFDPSFSGGVFVAAGDLNNSRPPGRLDLDVEIQTGLGDDRVLSDVVSFEVQVLRRVRIDTGAGADRVNVIWAKLQNKTEFPSAAVDDFDLDMGAGDDVVRFQSDVAADELQQKVRIDGGAGADQITVLLRRLANPHLPQDAVRASISPELTQIDIDGGSGNDRISLDFGGAILRQQAVDAVLRGGAGDDQVRARFDFAPGSTGRLSASVLGEAGNDELGLAVLNAGDLDLLFALLDGGPGRDRCRTTANVVVKNCP